MHKKFCFGALVVVLLGGCVGGSSRIKLEASNAPSQCASRMVMKDLSPQQRHDYMQRCTAGYDAAHASDDDTFTLDLPKQADSSDPH